MSKKKKPDFSKPKPIVSKSKKSAVDYDEAIAEQKAIQAAIDKELEENSISKNSKVVEDSIKSLYFRLNLPQENS